MFDNVWKPRLKCDWVTWHYQILVDKINCQILGKKWSRKCDININHGKSLHKQIAILLLEAACAKFLYFAKFTLANLL